MADRPASASRLRGERAGLKRQAVGVAGDEADVGSMAVAAAGLANELAAGV